MCSFCEHFKTYLQADIIIFIAISGGKCEIDFSLIMEGIRVDVLQQREPWREDDEAIFIAAAMNQITACVTAKQIADIHYMTKKLFKTMILKMPC